MLSRSPPEDDPTLPSVQGRRSRGGSKVEALLTAAIMKVPKVLGALLIFFVAGTVMVHWGRGPSREDRTRIEAAYRLHQIGYALMHFWGDCEPARDPSAATAAEVKAKTSTPLTLGSDSSNQVFRQLLVSDEVKEEIFYFPGSGAVKPDNDFHDNAHALAPGECGFACVAGPQSLLDPYAPVVFAPMIKGKLEFDPKPLAGKAIFLFPEKGDVETMPIGPDGHVRVNGMDIFDPRQPFWHGVTPDIKWQE